MLSTSHVHATLEVRDNNIVFDACSLVQSAESSSMQGVALTAQLHTKVDTIESASLDLSERIKALKQKIQQTRQHASSVSNQHECDASYSCFRK